MADRSNSTPIWLKGPEEHARAPIDGPELCFSPAEPTPARARGSRVRTPVLEDEASSPMDRGGAAIAHPRSALEESWDSLKFFAMNQGGRINTSPNSACASPPFAAIPESRSPAAAIDFMAGELTLEPSVEAMDENVFGDEEFTIPELPTGRILVLNLKTTWGVGHYVGLTGIEVLDRSGELVTLRDARKQMRASPANINVLPQFQGLNDPRTVDKLVDGINKTTDDLHMWLCPFTPGANHTVTMTFDEPTTISCIRLWNYNKSRIHAGRGARHVEISLDSQPIFKGEIQSAPGTIVGSEECCEVILYTSDELLLEKIDRWFAEKDGQDAEKEADQEMMRMSMCLQSDRPGTSQGRTEARSGAPMSSSAQLQAGPTFSSPVGARPPAHSSTKTLPGLPPRPASKPVHPSGTVVELTVINGWDSLPQVGLTGLEFTSADGTVLEAGKDFTIGLELPSGMPIFPSEELSAGPNLRRSVTCGDSEMMASALVNGNNLTTDPKDMVLLPHDPVTGAAAKVVVKFLQGSGAQVTSVKIWNYNHGVEGSWFGVKRVRLSVDGRPVVPSLLLRKAAGVTCFDYGQVVPLTPAQTKAHPSRPIAPYARNICTPNPYGGGSRGSSPAAGATGQLGMGRSPVDAFAGGCVTPVLPSGFIFKMVILATHGCPYYVGLNGLELYDENQCAIHMDQGNVAAVPESINVLPEIAARGGDARSLDKIYDGVNDTTDDRHMWLTPFDPNEQVQIICFFDEPITISMVKLWNYAKAPHRGVSECAMYLDDVEIFRGGIREAPSDLDPTTQVQMDMSQSIVFSDDPDLIAREARRIFTPGDVPLNCYNDNVPINHKSKQLPARPGTSVVGR